MTVELTGCLLMLLDATAIRNLQTQHTSTCHLGIFASFGIFVDVLLDGYASAAVASEAAERFTPGLR